MYRFTDRLAGYVAEEGEERALQTTPARWYAKRCGGWRMKTRAQWGWQKPTAEDILTDLTEQQLDGIRRRVRAGIKIDRCR